MHPAKLLLLIPKLSLHFGKFPEGPPNLYKVSVRKHLKYLNQTQTSTVLKFFQLHPTWTAGAQGPLSVVIFSQYLSPDGKMALTLAYLDTAISFTIALGDKSFVLLLYMSLQCTIFSITMIFIILSIVVQAGRYASRYIRK